LEKRTFAVLIMVKEVETITKRRRAIRWVRGFVIIYCLIGIAAYHLQEKFLFHPVELSANTIFKFSHPFKELNIWVNSTSHYNIVQFTTRQQAKGVVLYFHGNQDNISHYAPVATNMTRNGYEVWMIDYPGFGKSKGELTEQVLYDQALQLYKMARARFSPDSIVIYGRSLGTGVASELASVRDCKRLILETPYYSMPSVASTYLWMYPVDRMIKYKLPTNEYLTKVTAPVTIFHGTNDGVIPYDNAAKLKQVLKSGDEFVTINGGSHNDLNNHKEMVAELNRILSL
jgi:uncharacterized protein